MRDGASSCTLTPLKPRLTARSLRPEDHAGPRPIYAVWELTLRCDHACAHCGSRAASARPDELSTAELLDVAAQLVRLGTREVTLIGGEAYLRADCVDVTRFLSENGVRVAMQTGGLGLTRARAEKLRDAGMKGIGVSIDGPAEVHDRLRARPGSHAAALEALAVARDLGFSLTSNMQVNRLNAHLLREHAADMRARGVRAWRCQLTVPMGRAADRPDWILEPWRIVDVIDTLADIQREVLEARRAEGKPPWAGFHVQIGNNVGYYGPHEQLLRNRPGGADGHWRGCHAGTYSIGIESDGTVKGCPSLPTAPYVGGNVRELSLEQIWAHGDAMQLTRPANREALLQDLWGFCRTCYYAEECRAGCNFTAHCTLGRRGNMPFCYHRATQLARRGIRERLVPVERAAGIPYDFGRFELVEEPAVVRSPGEVP